MSKHLILMLEYDEDDQYITMQYFQKQNKIELKIVGSSEEVITYLSECKLGNARFPSMLLLNYNSTPLNAVELIGKVKGDKALRHIPAVVLSGTIVGGVVRECYTNGASSFIRKPNSIDETNNKIQSFINYWFETIELP